MGQKVNPKSLRIGITTTWRSRWYGTKQNYIKQLEEDVVLRRAIMKKYRHAAVADVEIERSGNDIKVIITTARPGVLIGRGGTGIEDLSAFIKKEVFPGQKLAINVDIREIRQSEESAALVAQNVAEQLEKRMPFRRILKSMLDQVEKTRGVQGVKISVSGRIEWG